MVERKIRPGKLIVRLTLALGVGLGAAALWWEYSEVIMGRLANVVGIEETINGL